jgi:hypothetical protein
MRLTVALLVAMLPAAAPLAQRAPPELSALAAKVQLDRPVVAWCRGEFRSARPGAFAAAVTSAAGGGRYVVLEADAPVMELASFTGTADLSCYSRAEADRLNVTISRSTTIHGQIAPRWNTTVVCGFVENTSAVCWQYSPADRAFVKVGEWVT